MRIRKMLIVLLTFALLFNTQLIASEKKLAESTPSQHAGQIGKGEKDEQIVAVYRMSANGPVQMTLNEYYGILLHQIHNENKEQELLMSSQTKYYATRVSGVPFIWYNELGSIDEVFRSNLQTRISNFVYNEGTEIAELEVTGSKTQGSTANFSLSSGEKTAIQVETGISYYSSYTFSQTIKQRIPGGCKGWMEFYPIMKNSYGYLQYGVTTSIYPFYSIYSEVWTDVYFPRELSNGQLDGVYILKQAPI
jgi:hypothetical protein